MEENKDQKDCGCGTGENKECCNPKSSKKRMWTTIIFIVVIVAAGLLISYKMFCPEACKNKEACPKDSTASCCPGKNMNDTANAVPSCCAGKAVQDTSSVPPCCAKK
jgi:hypothetical protein